MGSDDDASYMGGNLTGPDLNQEPRAYQPIHRVTRYNSMLNELGATQDGIQRRIRQLESATDRVRMRHLQSRNAIETIFSPSEMNVDDGLRSLADSSNIQEPERGKGCKRDSSHLMEKAPETDSEVKKPDTEGKGSFFDCSICLELAKEPILTCCGHLFCWACFYQVSKVDSLSKECPVCKGEVSDSTVTPIYGNGESEGIRVTESGLLIPPRPKGRRVESVRQRVTQQSSLFSTPISDALSWIMVRISPIGDGQASQQTGGVQGESAGGEHNRVRPTSLSFLPSAFSNAERLDEDLESVINNQMLGNETPPPFVDVESDSSRSIEETTAPISPFILRRNVVVWNSNVVNRGPREPRRRRLN